MKKSIFLFFAAILCAMSATAATYYYRGVKNNWGATPMTLSADGAYYYYEASAGAHEFKLTDNDSWSGAEYTNITPTQYNKTDIKLSKPGNVNSPSTAAHYILLYFGNDNATPVVCASTTLPNGLNDVWIKHDWGGADNWTYKQATNNGDGTFSLSAKYGASGCNVNAYNGSNAQWYYGVSDMEVEAGLEKGDEAVFTVNAVTRKISITKKVNKNLGDITITMNCTQQPKIYFWDVEGKTCAEWPGEDMVAAGANTYTYTFEDVDVDLGVNYKINLKEVNENEWASGDLNAKADVNHDASILNITSIAMHGNFSGGWKDSEYYSVNDENYNSATLKMTIEKGSYEFGMRIGASDNWTSNGKTFTRTNSSYVVKAGTGSGNLKLTADMTGEYEFKWTYKTNTLEIVFPEEEVVVPHTYTVVGSSPELFINIWSPAETANNMEKQTDGSYKKVYNNIELTSDVEWKIAKDGAWWGETPLENQAANGNSVLTISKSGIYNVTFTLSADLKTAHAEAELLEETNTVADCFVSGNAALTGGAGWAGNEFKMEYDPATETYSYTLTGLVTDEAYELKVVLGGVWYTYANLASIPTGVTEGNDHSIAFKMAAAGDVVVTYNVEAGITLSGDFAEPAPEVPVTLYFVNAENWTNLKAHIWIEPSGVSYKPWEESESLTDTGNDHNGADIYSYTFSNKYNRIIWKGDDAKQTINDVATYDVAKPYYCQGFWYATLDEIPAAVDKKYYVKGTHNEWTADATSEMTLDGEVYKKEVTLAKDVEFKINDGADGWWGKDNLGGKSYNELDVTDNGNLKMKEAKTFTIIFNPAKNLITFEGLTEKAPAKCYLMGIGGDWTTGIEMEEDGDQFKLLCQPIAEGEQFKFKYGDTWSDGVENHDFPGIDWKEGNIVLPEGIYDFYFKKESKKAYIAAVYLRDVTNKWGTICLPHASTSFSGAKFYEVSSLDPTKGLWLDQLAAGAQLEAGKPYVFEATASTIKVTYTDAAVAKPVAGVNGLTGTFTDIAAGGVLVGNYIIANNAVWVANASNDLPANRAYIANTVPTTEQPKLPGRRRVCMGENATTGLDQIVAPAGQAVKAIENGQLIIIRDGVKYNVQGQVIR